MAGSPLCNRAVFGAVIFMMRKLKIVVLFVLNSPAELNFEDCSVCYILYCLRWRKHGC